ncbi:uroplakin-3a isoform X2 [Pseudophryne corroboree]|uniref:uroplakin-3a isoform X2 n=1 Tax=Pseudophryne corroboree TaxID=495146 RepID=UPI0030818973
MMSAQFQVPLLASSNVCRFNPTQTTIALEKPYCFYISVAPAVVSLYVATNGAPSTAISSTNTYTTTGAGSTAPYLAATFENPNCTNTPVISQLGDPSVVQSILDRYIVRVGNDENCFNKIPCNGPLKNGTGYRFKYLFYNSNGNMVYESDWSSQITTSTGKSPGNMDTWPGGRSGGMIVITSILSVLMFLILAGLVAAVISNLVDQSSVLGTTTTTTHETRTTHNAPRKSEGVTYATTTEPGPGERYSAQPQT